MKIIGHRGAKGLAPENTIASFKKALEHNVDGIEFDLHVTKDGVVVVHHDPELTDPDGSRHVIDDTTYEELKQHKQDMPTFEELLETIGHQVTLYFEIKPGVPPAPIVKIIKAYLRKGWKPEYFHCLSFSKEILLEFQRELPDIPRMVSEKWSGVRATRRARQVGTKYILMNQKWLWWGFIRSISRGGWKLSTYTLDDPAKARRWEKYGLYGVVTDYPDQFESFKR
jgi:glycerophosphoryl diester phosphodiesterase